FPTDLRIDIQDYLVLLPVIIPLIGFLLILKDNFYKSVVDLRKSFQVWFVMQILIFGSFYVEESRSFNHFLLGVLLLSIYLAYFFTHAKIKWFYETLYILMLLTIVYLQFF